MNKINKFEGFDDQRFTPSHKKGVTGMFNKFKKLITTEPLKVPILDDTTPKYTEKELFEATEESFQVGYSRSSGNDPENIKNDLILNVHKKWFLNILKTPSFKRK